MRPLDVTPDEAVVWMLDVAQRRGPSYRMVAAGLAEDMRREAAEKAAKAKAKAALESTPT